MSMYYVANEVAKECPHFFPPSSPVSVDWNEVERSLASVEDGVDFVAEFEKIANSLIDLYRRKNHDYGNSFHKTWMEEGASMARIRLSDKLERFKTLTRGNDGKVKDESIRDTLMDLAAYSIMTIIEFDIALKLSDELKNILNEEKEKQRRTQNGDEKSYE